MGVVRLGVGVRAWKWRLKYEAAPTRVVVKTWQKGTWQPVSFLSFFRLPQLVPRLLVPASLIYQLKWPSLEVRRLGVGVRPWKRKNKVVAMGRLVYGKLTPGFHSFHARINADPWPILTPPHPHQAYSTVTTPTARPWPHPHRNRWRAE